MITWVSGNILESKKRVIVIPVNCVGVMGAGLAKQAALTQPGLLDSYKAACRAKLITVNGPLYTIDGRRNRFLMFPTKLHWKDPSKLEWIDQGLQRLSTMEGPFAIPPLGCGLGKLKWPDVRQLMEKHLSSPTLDVEVYCPHANL
jgi:hypothetical protein